MKKEDKKKLLSEIESCIDWKQTEFKLLERKVILKNLSPEEKNRAMLSALAASGNTVETLLENDDKEIDNSKEIKKEDFQKEFQKDDEKITEFNNPNLFGIAIKIYIAIESIYLVSENKNEKCFNSEDYETLKSASEVSKVWDLINMAAEYNENDVKKK